MNKHQLRIHYKSLRNALSLDDIETKSLEIANQLLKMDIWKASFYHVFLSITEQKEVQTEFLLNILSGKDKHIILSKSDFSTLQMTHYLLTDTTRIQKNKYNIPEPVEGIDIDVKKIDVVFVPLLAFDKNGHRVGYGKGFYDKFLSECQPETIKIGLSFFEAEEQINDVFESDMALDYCVTPHQIYRF